MNRLDLIDFEKLVEFLSTRADSFSFTAWYGEKRLSKEDYAAYIAADKKRVDSEVRMLWDKYISQEDKKRLPPFDEIYAVYEKRNEVRYKLKKRIETAERMLSYEEQRLFRDSPTYKRMYENAHKALKNVEIMDIGCLQQIFDRYNGHIESKINAEFLLEETEEYSENYGLKEIGSSA